MTTNQSISSKEFNQLLEINSDSLAEDLMAHLKQNNKTSHFEVADFYPELCGSLIKEIIDNFHLFNVDNKYLKEIDEGEYTIAEKKFYYSSLLFKAALKLMTFESL
jgi:hypothetical protein